MTEQEFSALFDGEEEALLGELGQTLRDTNPLDLPGDFARQTARSAVERFERLSPMRKLAVRLEPVLGSSVASPRAFPFSLGLLGGTIFGVVLGQQAIGDLGLVLLALVFLWSLLSHFCLPRTGPGRNLSVPTLSLSVFYLLPILSATATAIFCGGLVTALGLFSINFKAATWNTILLGPAAGLAVFFYLLSALMPTWIALQRQSVGRPRWMSSVQLFHALWCGILASFLTFLYNQQNYALWVWGSILLVALAVSWTLGYRQTLEEEGRPALWRALGKSARSLMLGGFPIAIVLVGSYQAALTRRVEQPALYQATLTEVSAWVKQQEQIPANQNGWSLVREAMTSRESKRPELAEQLKAGGLLYKPDGRADLKQAREQFLKALPVIEQAMTRPHFSHISTQGFKMQALVPNFLLARSANQGLTSLAAEAIDHHRGEEALRLQLVNLAWSAAFREGSLISLMISTAQASIALENVERWTFETHPTADQLRRMLAGLRRACPDREGLYLAMQREIYQADRAFIELIEHNPESLKLMDSSIDQGGWQFLARMLPSSYWRSEHKAYLNLMLADQDGRRELGNPSATDPSELLPFSFIARQLAPMTVRAQAQVMVSLTRFKALETVVALELYQREQGDYPESLEQLVPAYLKELPKDAISPKVWHRKPALGYLRTDSGYRLTSQSPVYESVRYKSRQVFGPDGNYQLDELGRP